MSHSDVRHSVLQQHKKAGCAAKDHRYFTHEGSSFDQSSI